ncbi:MAG: WYL domain-containing protein [Ignavibacteriales bacterium]|nr:WYL domain-containing protein [Ignavibacteriales bacterium]
MRDIRAKVKRQSEILGLILSNIKTYAIADLAYKFNCEELTIKRDLKEIREMGIDIHSSGKNGVKIFNTLNEVLINDIVTQYLSSSLADNFYNKATKLLIKKLGAKALENITLLQSGIENETTVEIIYLKTDKSKVLDRAIEPMLIFQSDGSWRLFARHEGVLKQFLIDRILSIKTTEKKFTKISEEKIRSIFETSFKSWLGNDRYNIKLRFLEPWAQRLKPKQLMENQKVTENKDGSITFETVVNSLDEIASWIVSKGKGIIVESPKELKEKVMQMANDALSNYANN